MTGKSGKMARKAVLKVELATKKDEHATLKSEIDALQEGLAADQLTLQRLKRQKLMLKDEIARIEDQLTPDIIA